MRHTHHELDHLVTALDVAKLVAMVAAFASPANDVAIGSARPQRQANGFTGTKLAAKRGAA